MKRKERATSAANGQQRTAAIRQGSAQLHPAPGAPAPGHPKTGTPRLPPTLPRMRPVQRGWNSQPVCSRKPADTVGEFAGLTETGIRGRSPCPRQPATWPEIGLIPPAPERTARHAATAGTRSDFAYGIRPTMGHFGETQGRSEGKDGARASPLLSPAMCRPRTTPCSWRLCRSGRPWRTRDGSFIVHVTSTTAPPADLPVDRRPFGEHRPTQGRRPSGKSRGISILTVAEGGP